MFDYHPIKGTALSRQDTTTNESKEYQRVAKAVDS